MMIYNSNGVVVVVWWLVTLRVLDYVYAGDYIGDLYWSPIGC